MSVSRSSADSSVRLSQPLPAEAQTLLREVKDTLERMLQAPEGIVTHHSDDPSKETKNLELTVAVAKIIRAKECFPKGTPIRQELSAIGKIAQDITRKSDARSVVDRIQVLLS